MTPSRFRRDELLDDARFWALLYEDWVKPRVGDCFDDGEQYFFSVPESAQNAFFRDLEDAPTQDGRYPEYLVLLSLRNGWRVGVVLSMCPENFEIQDVVGLPCSDELIVFGVNGGNSRLPALRWEELLVLRDAAEATHLEIKAKAVLLLFPAICLSSDMRIEKVRQVVEQSWIESGIPITHANELVGRPIEDFLGSRQLYPEVKETAWFEDPKHGWINDSHHSLRNPTVGGSVRVIPAIRDMLASLSGA